MSEQHTQEPWELREVLHGAFNAKVLGIVRSGHEKHELVECIAMIDPIEIVGPLQKANARRIVACVNACAGIPTEKLEAIAATKSPTPLAAQLVLVYQQRDQLKSERDALLEALESIAEISTSRYAVDTANEAIAKIKAGRS